MLDGDTHKSQRSRKCQNYNNAAHRNYKTSPTKILWNISFHGKSAFSGMRVHTRYGAFFTLIFQPPISDPVHWSVRLRSIWGLSNQQVQGAGWIPTFSFSWRQCGLCGVVPKATWPQPPFGSHVDDGCGPCPVLQPSEPQADQWHQVLSQHKEYLRCCLGFETF